MSKKEKIEMNKKELEWRAEDDARTLMEYQKIFKDKKRLERAKEKLKEREKEAKDSLEDINKALK
ncbi:MAG: hypothetical protein E7168_03880 [Firmicutes bacterium]|nr:hypothetical protein [Bacillota bacterium]